MWRGSRRLIISALAASRAALPRAAAAAAATAAAAAAATALAAPQPLHLALEPVAHCEASPPPLVRDAVPGAPLVTEAATGIAFAEQVLAPGGVVRLTGLGCRYAQKAPGGKEIGQGLVEWGQVWGHCDLGPRLWLIRARLVLGGPPTQQTKDLLQSLTIRLFPSLPLPSTDSKKFGVVSVYAVALYVDEHDGRALAAANGDQWLEQLLAGKARCQLRLKFYRNVGRDDVVKAIEDSVCRVLP